MLNHPMGGIITEKDRPILGYLANIELDLHNDTKGKGYDLIFTFLPNNYFNGTKITKSLIMKDAGVLDRTESTKIEWKDNCNPTIKKQKKKKKGKRVNVETQCESFFNFFSDLDAETVKENKDKEKGDGNDGDDKDDNFEDDIMDKLADDLEQSD